MFPNFEGNKFVFCQIEQVENLNILIKLVGEAGLHNYVLGSP